MKTQSGQNQTLISEQESHIDTKNLLEQDSQESLLNSEEQLKDSKTPWRTPISARELANQANEIATMLLNNKIDAQTAQRYSALIRGISQLLSLEVSKARIEKTKIDLNLYTNE